MTKFAMINLKNICNKKIQNAFSKQYTELHLKELFKCKEVIELQNFDYDENKLKSITKIDENIFENFLSEIYDFDISSLNECNDYRRSTQKYFAFSNDASFATVAFEKLKKKVCITLFELNDEDDFYMLTESIESIKLNKELIRNLNNTKEAIDTLKDYENEFSVYLLRSNAEDEIDSKTDELESKVEEASEKIREMLVWT